MPMQQGVPTPSFEYQGDYNQMPAPNPPKSKLPFILGGVCALFAAAGIADFTDAVSIISAGTRVERGAVIVYRQNLQGPSRFPPA